MQGFLNNKSIKNFIQKNASKFAALFFFLISSVIFIYPKTKLIAEYTLSADELLSWLLTEKSFPAMWAEVARALLQPIYYTFLKLWLQIAPEQNDYWLRVPSIILSYMGIFFLSLQLEKRSNWLIASLMFVFLTTQDWVIIISTMARSYPLLLLISTVNLFFLNKVLKEGVKEKNYFYFILTLIMILFTHNSAIFYTLSVIGVLIVSKYRANILRERVNILFIFFFIIYFSIIIFQYTGYRYKVAWIGKNSWDFTYFESILITYVVSFIYSLASNKRKNKELVLLHSIPLIGFFIYFFVDLLIMPILVQRYFVIFYPLMAFAICDFLTRVMKSDFGKILGIFIIAIQFNAHSVGIYRDYYEYKIDYKNFYRELKKLSIDFKTKTVECVVRETYPTVLAPYSQMNLGRDICTYREIDEDLSADIIIYHHQTREKLDINELKIKAGIKYRTLLEEDNLIAFEKYE